MVDYIVVGSGLGGIAFCEQLLDNNCSFVVFDDNSQQSSNVAAGMYNPVVLKRFTAAWKAQEQLVLLHPYYKSLEVKLGVKLNHPMPVYRRLFSIEEQNMWFEASDKPTLGSFLSPKLIKKDVEGIEASYGFGEVKQAGWIHTDLLQGKYLDYLMRSKRLYKEKFDYSKLTIHENKVIYNGIQSRNIIFCEGFGLNANPFFNYLPLHGTKGELLEVEIPGLELDIVVKASVFLLPLGGHKYKVGATYNREDKTNRPTSDARLELETKLRGFLNKPYKVLNHLAEIRPTVTDRQPIIGKHPEYNNLFVLNGLGSRGVMIAPYIAQMLFDHITNQSPLPREIDIKRFIKRYQPASS